MSTTTTLWSAGLGTEKSPITQTHAQSQSAAQSSATGQTQTAVVSAKTAALDSLDALLSPSRTPPGGSQSLALTPDGGGDDKAGGAVVGGDECVDGETQDIPLNDTHFSVVPLSAAIEPSSSSSSSASHSKAGNDTAAGRPPPLTLVPEEPPSSSASDNNGASVEFLLARLDHKEAMTPGGAKRMSSEESRMLKDEFQHVRQQQGAAEPLIEDPEDMAGQIDWDFWGDVVNDYEGVARAQPKRLARSIERGIPAALRGMLWQLMSASKDLELEKIYQTLLKQSSPAEKGITRDLGRTFPHHAFFMDGHGVGQESLFNVLKAYSLYDTECGYCQGLPFIVAPLLLVTPDEEAFCLLVRIMQSYDLRQQFLPEMPGLQIRLFQFDRLLEELLPVLHLHFLRQGVKSSMFASQWFLTLFAYRFPLDFVFRIFDHILATGIESMFGFSLALLQRNEATLLTLKFDQILDFLKVSLLDCYKVYDPDPDRIPHPSEWSGPRSGSGMGSGQEKPVVYAVDEFVNDALRLRITPFQLDGYMNEYEELRRARNAHLVEMDNLRNANRVLMMQVKSLENSLSQLNAEHCDVIKDLVMAKVEREEMEGELVKYKMLYAQLMHSSEDARSSYRLSTMSKRS